MKMIVNIDKAGMMGLLWEKEVTNQLVGQGLLLVESMSDFRKEIGVFVNEKGNFRMIDNGDSSLYLYGIIMVVLFVVALFCPTIRKSIGLLLIILGAIFCLSCVGLIVGIPMILTGGILLFIKNREQNE